MGAESGGEKGSKLSRHKESDDMGETSRRRPGVQGIMVGRYLMGEVIGKGVSSEVSRITLAIHVGSRGTSMLRGSRVSWVCRCQDLFFRPR